MRRIVLSLAVLSAAVLGACSGGGSVLSFDSSSKADRVIVTASGASNIARVQPGGGIALSAISVRGSQNGYLSNNTYRWSAALVASGTYPINTDGQTKPCQPVNVTSGGSTFPLVTDMDFPPYAVLTIDPTNESNVIFSPPAVFPPPFAGATVTPNYPYCVIVSATDRSSGAVGSITVAVVNPSAPLN